jgi:hypothetical protein
MKILNPDRTICFVVILSAGLLVFVSGCQMQSVQTPVRICNGKENIGQAENALAQHRDSIKPIRAGGNLLLKYYDGDNKLRKENLGITLRYYPPDLLYFKGDVLAQEVLRLGTNADEFWVMFKPKEISTYHWGMLSETQKCLSGHWINPQNLIEALGAVRTFPGGILSSEEGLDVITASGPGGIKKRVYIDRCDYLTRRIEYYDQYGKIIASTDLDDYTQNVEESFIPRKIRMVEYTTDTTVEIDLRNVKLFKPSAKQLSGRLFQRPATERFEHVYRLNDECEFQQQ